MIRVSRGLFAGLFIASVATAMAAEKAPAGKAETFAGATKAPPVIIAPPPAEVVAEAIRAEMDAFARRMDACTRLRQIALETNNDALMNEVEEIERQADILYKARVGRLGIKGSDAPKAAPERRVPASVDPLKVGPPTPGRSTR